MPDAPNTQTSQRRPEPLTPTLAKHGSPAGEPVPGEPSSTTGAGSSPAADWPQAEPATAGVGPSSRDTPPPTGEEDAAEGTAQAAQPAKAAADKRPPRPAPQAKPAAATSPPAALPQKQHPPATPETEALVEAITQRLAENLAKALRQSVVEAVQGAGPAPRTPTAKDVVRPDAASENN